MKMAQFGSGKVPGYDKHTLFGSGKMAGYENRAVWLREGGGVQRIHTFASENNAGYEK